MVQVNFKTLPFYIDKIRNKEPFVFAKYGDGEFSAMAHLPGVNIDGHQYFPQMGDELLKSIIARKDTPDYFLCLQPMVLIEMRPVYDKIMAKHNLAITWHNADTFYNSLPRGFPMMIAELNLWKTMVVGPPYMREISRHVNYTSFVEVPRENCYLQKERIKADILALPKPDIISFSSSMLTEVLMDELYDHLPGVTMIDFGAIWDYYLKRDNRVGFRAIREGDNDGNKV